VGGGIFLLAAQYFQRDITRASADESAISTEQASR